MRGIVIVVADLYRPSDIDATTFASCAPRGALPGFEHLARFGAPAGPTGDWREWLAASLGCAQLAGVAPAWLAAAACEPRTSGTPLPASTQAAFDQDGRARWIATPVQLTASLAHLHLAHRGLLRLPRPQQEGLAAAFNGTFGSSGCELRPLPCGDFLLGTCGIPPVATIEPARCAGGDPDAGLPRAARSAALRRLFAEIEMWLHAQPLNEERRRAGEAPVTALWPWGAHGRTLAAVPRLPGGTLPAAYGCDACFAGLWHLLGADRRELPARLQDVHLADVAGALLIASVGGELQSEPGGNVVQALARLDERFVSPALVALQDGVLARVTLLLNGHHVELRRRGRLRVWRRARAALEPFA